MADPTVSWSESESGTYRDLSRYAVPERERQIAIVTTLVHAADVDGDVLDLCCGEGLLATALLEALPHTTVRAYDGSESMLASARERSGGSARLSTRQIDLAASDWRRFPGPLRAVVSSLAIHHLDGDEKRTLFADLHAALSDGGVFVLADVIQPATRVGEAIAGELWDEAVRRRALELDGTLDGFELFRRVEWNHFRNGRLHPIDRPSSLVEHVDWLRAAGFEDVDLHWMTAGQVLLSAWRRGTPAAA